MAEILCPNYIDQTTLEPSEEVEYVSREVKQDGHAMCRAMSRVLTVDRKSPTLHRALPNCPLSGLEVVDVYCQVTDGEKLNKLLNHRG
jgi:hypothetical protein